MKEFDAYYFCEKNTKKLSMNWELSPESGLSNLSEIGMKIDLFVRICNNGLRCMEDS